MLLGNPSYTAIRQGKNRFFATVAVPRDNSTTTKPSYAKRSRRSRKVIIFRRFRGTRHASAIPSIPEKATHLQAQHCRAESRHAETLKKEREGESVSSSIPCVRRHHETNLMEDARELSFSSAACPVNVGLTKLECHIFSGIFF